MTTIQRLGAALLFSVVGMTQLACSAAAQQSTTGSARVTTCDRSQFRVVVDVGHTNNAGGALSARGAFEYQFNFRLAAQIEQGLIDAGFDKALLVVTTQAPIGGLFQRASLANSLRADLFLSIHHDAVPDSFLQKWDYQGATHQYCDRFKGHSIFVSHDNSDYAGSLMFGQMLGASLKTRGLQYTPHYTEPFMGHRRRILVDPQTGVYRYDQLIVLRQTRMPAVLFEAGSIVNRDEELLLASPEHRDQISAAATEAVEKFCTARAGRIPVMAKATVHPRSVARSHVLATRTGGAREEH